MKLPPRKYIYRRQGKHGNAWYVAFRRRHAGSQRRAFPEKFFPDSKHGGREAGLRVARAWRDQEYRRIIKALGWTRARKRMDLNTPQRRTHRKYVSTENGVTLFYYGARPPYWRAQWPGGNRSFGVLGWGYASAYRQATETRRRMAGLALNRPPIPPAPPIPLDVKAYIDGATMEQIRRARRARKRKRKRKP